MSTVYTICALEECQAEIGSAHEKVIVRTDEVYHPHCAAKKITYLRNGLISIAQDARIMANR